MVYTVHEKVAKNPRPSQDEKPNRQSSPYKTAPERLYHWFTYSTT